MIKDRSTSELRFFCPVPRIPGCAPRPVLLWPPLRALRHACVSSGGICRPSILFCLFHYQSPMIPGCVLHLVLLLVLLRALRHACVSSGGTFQPSNRACFFQYQSPRIPGCVPLLVLLLVLLQALRHVCVSSGGTFRPSSPSCPSRRQGPNIPGCARRLHPPRHVCGALSCVGSDAWSRAFWLCPRTLGYVLPRAPPSHLLKFPRLVFVSFGGIFRVSSSSSPCLPPLRLTSSSPAPSSPDCAGCLPLLPLPLVYAPVVGGVFRASSRFSSPALLHPPRPRVSCPSRRPGSRTLGCARLLGFLVFPRQISGEPRCL